jgi:hypothetical protein
MDSGDKTGGAASAADYDACKSFTRDADKDAFRPEMV